VKKEKPKLLVVFEDGKKPLEAIADNIKTAIGDKAQVKIRSTSEMAIAELLASDAYAFGVEDSASPSWTELKRLLKGMNLAGRKAGYFSLAEGQAEGLKKAFKDADLKPAGPDLVNSPNNNTSVWGQHLVSVL